MAHTRRRKKLEGKWGIKGRTSEHHARKKSGPKGGHKKGREGSELFRCNTRQGLMARKEKPGESSKRKEGRRIPGSFGEQSLGKAGPKKKANG